VARVPDGLRRIDAAAVRRDPAAAGERAARWLADAGAGVWLHIDLEVLDPAALPAARIVDFCARTLRGE
jgi:arginase